MNDQRAALIERIFRLPDDDFETLALDIFNYQSRYNDVYKSYLGYLNFDIERVKKIKDIPCLPIRYFKDRIIQTGTWEPIMCFESSGTTGSVTSKHLLRELDIYKSLSFKSFEDVYGLVNHWCFLALLPHYLERKSSSLVQMVKMFIDASDYPQSGFYLDNLEDLVLQIKDNQTAQIPTILIGVSFAFLDLVEMHDVDLKGIVVMETGGMKGRRAEWDKETLHRYLSKNLKVDKIHSEYGMTELLSQCYSKGDGVFKHSPTMHIVIKEMTDPFQESTLGKSGVVNVVDLGNIDTCSFIETQDLGIKLDDNHFKLQGRLDHSDIRGCNLMVI